MRAEVGLRADPTDVAPPEAVLLGRMHIDLFVAVAVMAAMVGGPPQWAALDRSSTQQRHAELRGARGLEGAVAEVAVVEARDGEHAHHIQRYGPAHCEP